MAIVEVGRSSSRCMDCAKARRPAAASPSEPGHMTVLGYGPTNGTPGCGELWTGVVYGYYNNHASPAEEIYAAFPNLKGLPVNDFVWE